MYVYFIEVSNINLVNLYNKLSFLKCIIIIIAYYYFLTDIRKLPKDTRKMPLSHFLTVSCTI